MIAVLYVARAEAWEKRREEDSVAVLEEEEGRGVGISTFKRQKGMMMMISHSNRGEAESYEWYSFAR